MKEEHLIYLYIFGFFVFGVLIGAFIMMNTLQGSGVYLNIEKLHQASFSCQRGCLLACEINRYFVDNWTVENYTSVKDYMMDPRRLNWSVYFPNLTINITSTVE